MIRFSLLVLLLVVYSNGIEFMPGIYLDSTSKVYDWKYFLENDIKFGLADATSGNKELDSMFAHNWQHFLDLNITPGAVHWLQTSVPAHENFEHVDTEIFGKVNIDSNHHFVVGFLYNDAKLAPEALADHLHTFLWLVEQKHGIRPIIWTSRYFWDQQIGGIHTNYSFQDYPLMIDDFTLCLKPNISDTWSDYHIWRFTTQGNVRGVGGEGTYAFPLWVKVKN